MTYTRAEVVALMVGVRRMKMSPADPTDQAEHVALILDALVLTSPAVAGLAERLLAAYDGEQSTQAKERIA